MVGEIGDDDGLARVAEYTSGGDKLHMAYCFDLLGTAHSAAHFRGFVQRFEEVAPGGWPCWALSNHDVVRVASRWGSADKPAHPDLLRLGAALQMSLRGSPCIYQGDELGLPEADIAFEDLQDPYGITMWPEFKGRDGCRTAHPWARDSDDLGFSSAPQPAAPWLPVIEPHRALAVDVQERDAGSLLNFYRGLLRWRKTQPALVSGTLHVLPAHPQVLAFVRALDGVQILCVFNFSDAVAAWEIPAAYAAAMVLPGSGLAEVPRASHVLQMPAWGGAYLRLV